MTTNTVAINGKFHLTSPGAIPETAKRPCNVVQEAIDEAIYAELMQYNLHDTEYTVDITNYRAPSWVWDDLTDGRTYTVRYTVCVTFADPECVTFFQLTPG